MFSAVALDGGCDAPSDTAVAVAALQYERTLRDAALESYLEAREAFDVASVAQRRRRLAVESHTRTLQLLQQVVEEVRAAVATATRTVAPPRESTVVAAAMILAAGSRSLAATEHDLAVVLARERRHRTSHPAALSSAPGTSSPANDLCLSSWGGVTVQPLRVYAALRLDYASLLQEERLPIFSEVARAEHLTGAASAVTSAPQLQEAREAVAAARESLSHARQTEQSVKRRVYELHQALHEAIMSRTTTGAGGGDGVAAHEIRTQLRRELAVGRVTLLRALCGGDSDAADDWRERWMSV
ncbi:hypothetical protein NESM_000245400 [Novymonas esmeraldas]|uniref:Uncharacterized protein n=1 Tax=Novymonas esmeraldas TaxID=1808958 RepID=A0AAW0F9M5_9TRYP